MWEWRHSIGEAEPLHQSPTLAIREGDWKLLINHGPHPAELFHIPHYPSELKDQATAHPDIVAPLSAQVLAWRKTLPAGPYDSDAVKRTWFWPGDKRPTKAEREAKVAE